MGDMLALPQRLEAYLEVVRAEPELTIEEREHLFSLALWPDPEPDYEHLMVCRDRFCQYCAGTGVMAA